MSHPNHFRHRAMGDPDQYRIIRRRRLERAATTAAAIRHALEPLEVRRLLSIATPMDDALARHLQDNGLVQVMWNNEPTYVKPGEWIVRQDGVRGNARQQLSAANTLLAKLGQGLKATRQLGDDGLFLVESPAQATFQQVSAALGRLPGFRSLEPNFAVWAQGATSPNDPFYTDGSLWGLNNTGQPRGMPDADIDAPEAWQLANGSASPVVVGVIDTGVNYTHVDLHANIWTNPGEIPGNGIDDEGDGYVDDVHGYDFCNSDSDPMDDCGHGTHVAGTIAAMGNNGIGVVGIASNAQIVAIKFLDDWGSGTTDAAIASVNYATALKRSGVNIRLTNNSWGGSGYSEALRAAIAESGSEGMLFMAAAGNSNVNLDSTPYYPAAFDLSNIISVAATDRNDVRASFSNYGATRVDLAAPGVDIWSTGCDYFWDPNHDPNGYMLASGTSMATPHVSGVAALAMGFRPEATFEQIRDAIFMGANRVASMQGMTVTGGRLNAANTLRVLDQSQLSVIDSTPSAAAPASLGTKDFVVRFSAPIDSSTLDPSDFSIITAGGTVQASSFEYSAAAPNVVTFHFVTSPVTTVATYTMNIAGGAILSQSGVQLSAWGEAFASLNAAAVSDNSVNTNLSLPDGKTVSSTLTVNHPGMVVRDVNVRLYLTHKFDQQLKVYLVSPLGTRVELFTNVGGKNANFGTATVDCTLDDEAATVISSGAAPFAGVYRPEGTLGAIDGELASGNWKLEITDATKGQTGILKHWSLDFVLCAALPLPPAASTAAMEIAGPGGTAELKDVLQSVEKPVGLVNGEGPSRVGAAADWVLFNVAADKRILAVGDEIVTDLLGSSAAPRGVFA